MQPVKVVVPATSANLGPGFDCLGMALGLYNEFVFATADPLTPLTIEVEGEAAELVPRDASNLVIQAAERLALALGRPLPPCGCAKPTTCPPPAGWGAVPRPWSRACWEPTPS
ncbi:MAG: hypothetical protein IPL28_11900 [Chloroflexi bacterium]|nr:hypothetical protein [Chloroflexota bacterium]